jgi:hypothetical protein
LVKAGGRKISCEIHKLTDSIWNKEELPEEWKESIIVPVYKKGDKTDCSINYRGISILSTTYKILSSILLSRLTPCAQEIIGDHQYGFQCNRLTTEHVFYTCQILEEKWEFNGVVHQLFIGFKRAFYLVRNKVLYNFLIEYGIPMTLVRLLKMCQNETCSIVRLGKHFSDMFPITNSLITVVRYIAIAFQLCFRVCHWEVSGKPGCLEIK